MNLPDDTSPHTPAQAAAWLDRVVTEYEHHLLSESEARSLLPRLRWRDDRGGRYTIGVRSKKWYAWDGVGWVRGSPPQTLWIDLDPEPQPEIDLTAPLGTAPAPVAARVPAGPFAPTHRVPSRGLPTWTSPDVRSPGVAIEGGQPVQVIERWGDWAHVVCWNGWSAWVDARLLE